MHKERKIYMKMYKKILETVFTENNILRHNEKSC